MTHLIKPPFPQLIAHRGNRASFPENTRASIESALHCGARFVEFDVQFTKDEVPMVIHDVELKRITGENKHLFQLRRQELHALSACEPERFADKFAHEPIASLSDIAILLQQWPQAKAFVEIKRATISEFGIECVMQRLHEVLSPILEQCILISFNHGILQHHLAAHYHAIGWVFDQWQETALEIAQHLQPDYLFVDVDCIPPDTEGLWQGHWQWVLYEISDPMLALQWAKQGVLLIETDDICGMLHNPVIRDHLDSVTDA